MNYALKLVDPGWHEDPRRGQSIAFSKARYSEASKIEPGTAFLIYANEEGLVGAGIVTGKLTEDAQDSPYPLVLPVALRLEVSSDLAVGVWVLQKPSLRLRHQSWILLTAAEYERGVRALTKCIDGRGEHVI